MCPIPKETQDFVVDDDYCDCWGNADYDPPEDMEYLRSEREIDQIPDEETEEEEFEVLLQRPRKSFQQRLLEKKTRAKRVAMAKEAHRYHVAQEASQDKKLDLKSSIGCSSVAGKQKRYVCANEASQKNLPTSRHILKTSIDTKTSHLEKLRPKGSGGMNRGLTTADFPFSKRKDADNVSLRSGSSRAERRRILDAIKWDSDSECPGM
ncbi:hypothetical protein ACEQ8H_007487 [Pleosporales sp. CAS-2024a]